MINWISPGNAPQLYSNDWRGGDELMPAKVVYEIKLTEIKWLLKEKKEKEAERVRDWVVEHVTKWLGEYHIVLS